MADRRGRGEQGRGPPAGSGSGGGASQEAERQRTIDALCDAFANDEIRVEEFERRVEVAHRAETPGELRRLLSDLAPTPPAASAGRGGEVEPTAPGARGSNPVVPIERVRGWGLSVGMLGGTSRRGRWIAARKNFAIGVMGGCTLDFRETVLPPGVTEVHAVAFMGGVEVIVPPWLRVETSGVGILGGFEHHHDTPAPADPGAPVLRVSGIACMGGVEVKVRHPGESAREARRRLREGRRETRRLRRGEGE